MPAKPGVSQSSEALLVEEWFKRSGATQTAAERMSHEGQKRDTPAFGFAGLWVQLE